MNVFSSANYIRARDDFDPALSIHDAAPLFRRTFALDKLPVQARIMVQSPGYAHFYLNGQRITDDLFISPVSRYDRILWYNTYDVTSLVRSGDNVLAVVCGNGFYNEGFSTVWGHDKAPWRDAPKFILSLECDGEMVLISDERWLCCEDSFITYHQLRSGECVDMRKYDAHWTALDFNDSAWHPAVLDKTPPTGEFYECRCQPIRACETYKPVRITQYGNRYVLDFGVNLSGYVRVCLTGKAGDTLTLYHTEEIDENGAPKYNNLRQFYPEVDFQVVRITLGDIPVAYDPYFTYFGFRYVVVEGLDRPPCADEFTAVFVHQDIERISDFRCGDELLNFIYTAGLRATLSNTHYCLTDCPTREKLGWLNDAQASCEQTYINFDIGRLYEKWMVDIRDAIREDGALPGIVPSPGFGYGHGPVCDGMLAELPWRHYQYTGDASMLIDALPDIYRSLDYLIAHADAADYRGFLRDWLGYAMTDAPIDQIVDCYIVKYYRIIALGERLAGNKQKAERAELALKARVEFMLNAYFDEVGVCRSAHQTALSMCLSEGVFRDKTTLCQQLIETVEHDNCQSTCGMLGTQFIYDALTESGRPDLALRMLHQSEPGYATWHRNGATTLWERWDGLHTDSHNHHMYSCVIGWFFKSLLGITPTQCGNIIELTPHPLPELGFCEGHVQLREGTVYLRWQIEGERAVYTVRAPAGVRIAFQGRLLLDGMNIFDIPLN